MEEFTRQKKEKRRREKQEHRQKRATKDVAIGSECETVLTALEQKRSPPQDIKQSALESIRDYGWVASSKKLSAAPAQDNCKVTNARMNEDMFKKEPRRLVQFPPSPGSAVSDLTFSQSSPSKPSQIFKKHGQSTLNFQSVNFDSDDDLLDLADKLWKEPITNAAITNLAASEYYSKNDKAAVLPTFSEEASDNEDLVTLSENVDRSRRVKRMPQNPLALYQRIEENKIKCDKEGRKELTAKGKNKRILEDAALWSDSDEGTSPGKGVAITNCASSLMVNKLQTTVQPNNLSEETIPNNQRILTKKRTRQASIESDQSMKPREVRVSELKPEFQNPKLGPPSALIPLTLAHSHGEHQVPASINRYLKDYQRMGIRFIHRRIVEGKGCILGDDMGLGKTVQVISMLAAMLGKSGTGEDLIVLAKRRNKLNTHMVKLKSDYNHALRNGTVTVMPLYEPEWPKYLPVLVIVPSSVTQNWLNEFDTWGHFGVALYHGGSRALALERLRSGIEEVLVCSKGVLVSSEDLDSLKAIPWKLIVVDEQHQQKNRKSAGFLGLASLRDACQCPILGMTGTIMQNNPEELWSCVETVAPGFLETWEEFKSQFATPIMMARTKTASEDIIRRGDVVVRKLTERLKILYIKRYKSQVLADDLPMKDERVLFCEPSPIQKVLYQHILMMPDFVLLKYAQAPCECGVNRAIFQQFKRLRSEKEKLDFQRRKRDEIKKRCQCCWQIPLNPNYDPATCDPDEICDPMAPLWKWQHKSGECCKQCPFCLLFPALNKLLKLSSHPSLLQLDRPPDSYDPQSASWKAAMKDYDFAKVAIPQEVLRQLPGGDYIRQDGIMDQHTVLSGKMKVLAKLLREFSRRNSRLLLFSYSTQMLDLIQNFVRSEGYSFLRLDGSTPNKSRQALVDQYQEDGNIFLFLISTRAGGLGLNLTAANVVIVFDVEFNPSNDEQAQDRAFRIGQQRDVLVIRLVTSGTIEELKYIRQIYKVQLKQDTIGDVEEGGNKKAARMFRAVQGDKDRKGELFGVENLLRYKDGRFMDDLWKADTSNEDKLKARSSEFENRLELVSMEEVALGMKHLNEEIIDDIGRRPNEWIEAPACRNVSHADSDNDEVAKILATGALNHADFLQKEKGHAALEQGDDGFEEEQGGYSQVVNDVMECASDVDIMESHVDDDCKGKNRTNPVDSSPFQCLDAVNKPVPEEISSTYSLPTIAKARLSLTVTPQQEKLQKFPSPVCSFDASSYIAIDETIKEDFEEESAETSIPPKKSRNNRELVDSDRVPVCAGLASPSVSNHGKNENEVFEYFVQKDVSRNAFNKPDQAAFCFRPEVLLYGEPKVKSSSRKTTFSCDDLFLPSYAKNKNKRKMKRQTTGNRSPA